MGFFARLKCDGFARTPSNFNRATPKPFRKLYRLKRGGHGHRTAPHSKLKR